MEKQPQIIHKLHLPETPGPSDRLCSAQGGASWVWSHTGGRKPDTDKACGPFRKDYWKLTLRSCVEGIKDPQVGIAEGIKDPVVGIYVC